MKKGYKKFKPILFIVVVLFLTLSTTTISSAFLLPDTGQTKCNGNKGSMKLIAYSAPQKVLTQDKIHSINPLLYAVNSAGDIPTFTDSDIQKYDRKSLSEQNDTNMAKRRKLTPVMIETTNEQIRNTWKSVKLEVKDRLSHYVREYIVSVGDSLIIPGSDIRVEIKAFIPDFKLTGNSVVSNSLEPNNQATRVIIYEDGEVTYHGWLYARFPTINPFEHERYQIFLKEGIRSASKPDR
jgi:hypothetical protein